MVEAQSTLRITAVASLAPAEPDVEVLRRFQIFDDCCALRIGRRLREGQMIGATIDAQMLTVFARVAI